MKFVLDRCPVRHPWWVNAAWWAVALAAVVVALVWPSVYIGVAAGFLLGAAVFHPTCRYLYKHTGYGHKENK